MYNGIGLQTPRGSGTNGYIQRNVGYLRPRRSDMPKLGQLGMKPFDQPQTKEPDPDLLLHEQRRKIEVRLVNERLKMEKDGIEELRIQRVLGSLRRRWMNEVELEWKREGKKTGTTAGVFGRRILELASTGDSHEAAAWKRRQLEQVAGALRINGARHKIGDAFDPKKQAERKRERQKEWEERKRRMIDERKSSLLQLHKLGKRSRKRSRKSERSNSTSSRSSTDSTSSSSSNSTLASTSNSSESSPCTYGKTEFRRGTDGSAVRSRDRSDIKREPTRGKKRLRCENLNELDKSLRRERNQRRALRRDPPKRSGSVRNSHSFYKQEMENACEKNSLRDSAPEGCCRDSVWRMRGEGEGSRSS